MTPLTNVQKQARWRAKHRIISVRRGPLAEAILVFLKTPPDRIQDALPALLAAHAAEWSAKWPQS